MNESDVAVGVYTLVTIENGQPVTEQHHFTIPGEDVGIFETEAPNAINDNGVVAGLDGFFSSGEIIDPREVYLYADGVITSLGQPAVNSGLSVSAINNNNQIAVNWFDDVDFEFRVPSGMQIRVMWMCQPCQPCPTSLPMESMMRVLLLATTTHSPILLPT